MITNQYQGQLNSTPVHSLSNHDTKYPVSTVKYKSWKHWLNFQEPKRVFGLIYTSIWVSNWSSIDFFSIFPTVQFNDENDENDPYKLCQTSFYRKEINFFLFSWVRCIGDIVQQRKY